MISTIVCTLLTQMWERIKLALTKQVMTIPMKHLTIFIRIQSKYNIKKALYI